MNGGGSGGYPMGGYANAGVDTTPIKSSAANDYPGHNLGSPAEIPASTPVGQRAK